MRASSDKCAVGFQESAPGRRVSRVKIAFLLLVLLSTGSFFVPSASAVPRCWLGPDGEPLPFSDEDEVLRFLLKANPVAWREIGEGINRTRKVTLELNGIRANAVFRTVDRGRQERPTTRTRRTAFHDSYVFEVAAFEMSRLLGLDNVPPAVLRRLRGQSGSLQLWIEKASSDAQRIRKGKLVSDLAYRNLQVQSLKVFDRLIDNFDRNPGNLLADESGKLWFVDHTRSFRSLPNVEEIHEVAVIEPSLWQNLVALDRKQVRERVSRYLPPGSVSALMKRRERLIRHIEALIEERGEDRVLLTAELQRSTC